MAHSTSRPIDIYVRVSATAGRQGDSFQSPDAQAKRCRTQLAADGRDIGSVFTDLDQSGGKMDRPEFNKVLERIRTGESGGVIVADLSRFGRSTTGVLDAVAEISEAGAEVISCSEKLDTSTAMGRFVLTVLVALREMELDRFREQFDSATDTYLARGGHGGSFIPPGYDRDTTPGKTGRLVPNEHAPAIKRAFQMRAEGRPLSEIAVELKKAGVTMNRPVKPDGKRKRPAEPHTDWTGTAVRQLLENEVYLGIASARSKKRPGAHDPLVTRREFDAARSKHSPGRAKENGTRTEGALLTGLIHCGSCGGLLTNDGARYRCNSRARGTEPCQGRAVIARNVIEPFVELQALDFLGAIDFDSSSARKGPSSARLAQAVADAEEELAAYALHTPARLPGYADGLAQRERALIEARNTLDRATGTDVSWAYLSEKSTREAYASFTLSNQRKVIEAVVAGVTVMAGSVKVADRVSIQFRAHPLRKVKRPKTPLPPRP
jgi:site-specific DNA recombinase